MENEQCQTAKKQMMVLMQEGYRWQEAASHTGIRISRSTAYRWFHQFRTQGEAALHDGRHGHIAKMHQPIRVWLEARCRQEPSLPSSSLQKELNAHFGVLVSITHLNRIRAAQGKATRSGGKKITTKAQHLNETGKTGPGDCSWSSPFMRLGCLPT